VCFGQRTVYCPTMPTMVVFGWIFAGRKTWTISSSDHLPSLIRGLEGSSGHKSPKPYTVWPVVLFADAEPSDRMIPVITSSGESATLCMPGARYPKRRPDVSPSSSHSIPTIDVCAEKYTVKLRIGGWSRVVGRK
jgi:hypothetical protein